MDLLFELQNPDSRVVGTMTRAFVTPRTRPRTSLGVRFRPGGGFGFLGIAASEPRDEMLPIDLVWGNLGRALGERVADAKNASAAFAIIDRELLGRLPNARAPDARLETALLAIAEAKGVLPMERITDHADIGERQLERLFNERVGIGPKVFARVTRMRAVIDELKSARADPSWADLAVQFGYADQAHLIREFRSLAGVTPGQYVRSRPESEMSNTASDALPTFVPSPPAKEPDV